MSTTQVATGPRHPNVARKEHEALMRLIKIAKTDTGQARRVADFLLAWWNPTANGRFDFIDLWSVDRQIEEDILLLLTMAVRLQEYPDTLGYSNEFEWTGFEWIDCSDSGQSILSYVRRAGDEFMVVLVNLTPVPRMNYRIGIPEAGVYREVFNSDSHFYGGSNIGNGEASLTAEALPWMNPSYSLEITVPPLAAIVLAPVR